MKAGLGRATIRLHFAAFRSFFKFLTRRRGWTGNPLLEVQLTLDARGACSDTPAQLPDPQTFPVSEEQNPEQPDSGAGSKKVICGGHVSIVHRGAPR